MSWLLDVIKGAAGFVVPLWARWAMLAALAATMVGYGYLRGYLHEEHKFDAFQAQVDALAKDAGDRAAKRKAAQDQTMKEVADGYESDLASIEAYYAAHPLVVRARAGSSASTLPAASVSATEPHGPACEPGVIEPDRSLEERCALDAARVNRWIEFARKNAFPLGD